MATADPAPDLRGRDHECRELDGVVGAVRAGESRILVLRGEAGVGKTALLGYLDGQASDCRIARAAGVESEMELPFAGLHQLIAPFLDGTVRLPPPQRDALETALGIVAGDAPDLLLVGLAVLSLLSDAAEDRPLVCLVDDAQWLDKASAQVLAFVARRLLADPVGMVFAVREPAALPQLDALPLLVVRGLADDDARALLDGAIPGRLDAQVREQIIAEARGNPLALQELTRGMKPGELAGGFASWRGGPLATRLEQSFDRRLRSLPPDAQRLVLVAASDPTGDVALLWRAASRLDIDTDAATAVEDAGLIELGTQARFTHPLVRSAVYRGATLDERRTAHRALAAATDDRSDPDRRAWHQAHAAVGPDEEVAAELARSAGRAGRRGGAAAATAFLSRATELTPEPAQRGARALAAARAALDAAAPDQASRLLTTASLCPLDELQQATAMRLRARVAFAERRGRDAPPLLLEAATRLERLDAPLARETHLDTLEAAIFAGRSAAHPTIAEIARAARRTTAAPEAPSIGDLLVDGLATRFADGYAAGVPALQRLLAVLAGDEREPDATLQWLWMACRVASELWDDATWHALAVRQLRLARESATISALPFAVTYRAGVHIHAGEFAAASTLIAEANSLTSSVGSTPLLYTTIVLAAWQGRSTELARALDWGIPDATARGEGRGLTWCEYGTALLHNGLGNYPQALAAAQEAAAHDDLGIVNWALVELVEAAVRSDRTDLGIEAVERLAERTRASGTGWARGIEARSRALLTEGPEAEDLYQEAIDRLVSTRVGVHLARAHLVYGEWLRRQNRRVDAREQLRAAHDLFVRFGADGFAERTRRELMATGETVRKRASDTVDALTAQEAQIARLASNGLTNAEIGSQLFISPRTVEYHLRKVFTKLAITSRRELRHALPEQLHAPPLG